MLSGRRPDNLGLRDGRLAPCRRTPNCVSSQADAGRDAGHYIAPIAIGPSAQASWAVLVGILRQLPRVKLVHERHGYLHAEFTSRLLGFVDDVEFHLNEASAVIHVRSASRLGRRDFGVNRRRVEDIRRRLAPSAQAD